MRNTKEQFMAPKLGHIDEDRGEDYEGTFKDIRKQGGGGGGFGIQMPSDIRRYDSLLDTTNLALD